ncbi:MAG: rod shape-determining protein MreC [Bacteroidales bacterium]|nr:rod shape-determining protein MreC [Bacteroidales bacterium]
MQNLFRFIKKYSYVIVFLLLETIAGVLIVQNTYYQSSVIISWGNSIAGEWFNQFKNITSYLNLASTNKQLAEENARLRQEIANSYITYNKREFEINDTVYKQQYEYTEAQVIRNTWNTSNNYVMINKGYLHGIHPDMAVISSQGIVGVVVNTTKNFSNIMSILHVNSKNSIKIKRTGVSGTLTWDTEDYRYGTLTDIPTTHKLHINDTVITSGFSKNFPEGVPVGYIQSFCEEPGSGFYTIKIKFATEFNKLDYVYIVNNIYKEEQAQLIEATKKTESDE